MMGEFTIFEFIKDTFPISSITLIVFFSAFIKVFAVCMIILKFQERRISVLEKLLEKQY